MEKALPLIPPKRYFTIGEVSDLCGVKPYVLRYWEQEFGQLKPMKRRGNRRYYQHHEVLLIRRIRELLYDQGFTISGARNRLADAAGTRDAPAAASADEALDAPAFTLDGAVAMALKMGSSTTYSTPVRQTAENLAPPTMHELREELLAIRSLLAT
ncbi:MAG: MerR family transcriptional regulator [Burkholderiaceae bacterium]